MGNEPPPAPGKPPNASVPESPPLPGAPDSPSSPVSNEKEVDRGKANQCDKVDPELMRKIRIFNAKLDNNGNLYLRLNSCYRPPDKQNEFHYARMITWSASEIKDALKTKNEEEAKKIQARALQELKKQKGFDSDDEARKKAEEVKREIGKVPALPGVDNCPCGCGWPRSKHTYDPAKAIDANIYKKEAWYLSDKIIVHSGTSTSDPDYALIDKLTKESGLVWGINFTQIPVDPIHWELP